MSSHNALLKHVSIAAEDTSLVAKFDIDGNIPGQGAYVVGLVAATPDHSHQRRMGIEFMNGEAVSFYCFSHDGTEENFDLKGVEHSGSTITGYFPISTDHGPGQGPPHDGLQRLRRPRVPGEVPVEEAL